MNTLTNGTSEVQSMSEGVPEVIKHNTLIGSLSPDDIDVLVPTPDRAGLGFTAEQQAQQDEFRASQLREEAKLIGAVYNQTTDYDYVTGVAAKRMASDPRNKWIDEFIDMRSRRRSAADMSITAIRGLTEGILNGDQQKYRKDIEELTNLNAELAQAGLPEHMSKYLKDSIIRDKYYQNLKDERIPDGTLYNMMTNPIYRTITPEEMGKIKDMVINQSAFLSDLNNRFWIRADFKNLFENGDLIDTRGGTLADEQMKLLQLLEDPKTAKLIPKKDLIKYYEQVALYSRVAENQFILGAVVDGIIGQLYAQFNNWDNLIDEQSNALSDAELFKAVRDAGKNYGVNEYGLLEGGGYFDIGTAAMPIALQAAIESGADPALVLNNAYNSDYGVAYRKASVIINWGTLFAGGPMAKGGLMGAKLGYQAINNVTASMFSKIVPKIIEKRVEDAAKKVAANAAEATTERELLLTLKEAAKENMQYAGVGVLGNWASMQALEGIKQVDVADISNVYLGTNKDLTKSFYTGLTENAIANLGVAALFSAPTFVSNGARIHRINRDMNDNIQVANIIDDGSKLEVPEPVMREATKEAVAAGKVSENIFLSRVSLRDTVDSLKESGNLDAAAQIEKFMAKNKDKLNDADEEIADYVLPIEDAVVAASKSPAVKDVLLKVVRASEEADENAKLLDELIKQVELNIPIEPAKLSQLFNTVEKNKRIMLEAEESVANVVRGRIYNNVRDLRLKELSPEQIEIYSARLSQTIVDKAKMLGISADELLKKYSINFKIIDSGMDFRKAKNEVRDLGKFDSNSFTIYLSKDAGFSSIMHETSHALFEMLMREEDLLRTLKSDEAKRSVEVINEIRKAFPNLFTDGKKWSDLTHKEQETIHETVTGDFIYHVEGNIHKEGVLTRENMHNTVGLIYQAINQDMMRIYEDTVNYAKSRLEAKELSTNTIGAKRVYAGAIKRRHAKDLANIYGIDVSKTTEKLAMTRDWFNSVIAEETGLHNFREQFRLDMVEDIESDLIKISQVESFGPQAKLKIDGAIDILRKGILDVVATAKADIAAFSPFFARWGKKTREAIVDESYYMGSKDLKDDRSEWLKKKRNLESSTYVSKANEELKAAKAERKAIIDKENKLTEKYTKPTMELRKANLSLKAEIKEKKRRRRELDKDLQGKIKSEIKPIFTELNEVRAKRRAFKKNNLTDEEIANLDKKIETLQAELNKLNAVAKDEVALAKRLGYADVVKELDSDIKTIQSDIDSNVAKIKTHLADAKAARESVRKEHEAAGAKVAAAQEKYNKVKAEFGDAQKALESENRSITSRELKAARNSNVSKKKLRELHIHTEHVFNNYKKIFNNPESELRKDYETRKAFSKAMETVQIDGSSLSDFAMSLGYSEKLKDRLIAMCDKKGWINWDGKVDDEKPKEIITAEVGQERFASNGEGSFIQMLEDVADFVENENEYIRKIMDSQNPWIPTEKWGLNSVRPALQKAEQNALMVLMKSIRGFRRAAFENMYARVDTLGRGPAISNLAKMKQHNVGRYTYRDSSPHKFIQKVRLLVRASTKYMHDERKWPLVLGLATRAEAYLAQAREAQRIRGIIDSRIQNVRQTLKGSEKQRYDRYDARFMRVYELIAERAGLVQGKASWYKLTPDEQAKNMADVRHILRESIGNSAENAEVYQSLLKNIENDNLSGDAYGLQLGHLLTLTDTLSNLKKVAREVKEADKKLTKENRKALQETANKILSETLASKNRWVKESGMQEDGTFKIVKGIAESKSNQPWSKRTSMAVRSMFNGMRKVPFLLQELDGKKNGFLYNTVYTPIRKAMNSFHTDSAQIFTELADIFSKVKQLEDSSLKRHTVEIDVPYNLEGQPMIFHAVHTFGANGKYAGKPRGEVFQFMLHMGNADNRRAVAKEFGCDDPQLADEICKKIVQRLESDGLVTKEMMEQATRVWDVFRKLREKTLPVHERLTNERYKVIEGQKITFDFGEYEGGYVPLSVDERMVKPIDADSLSLTLKQQGDVIDSFTKERVASGEVRYDMSVEALFRRTREQLLYAHLAEPVHNVDTFLTTNKTMQHILKSMDNAYDEILHPWLLDVGTGGASRVQGSGTKFINAFANASSTMMMAFNMVNALMNFANFTLAAAVVNPSVILSGLGSYLTHKRFGGTPNNPTFFQSISNRSEFMAHRLSANKYSYDRLLRKASGDGKILDTIGMINDSAYIFQTVIQNRIDAIMWAGSYDKAMKRLAKEHPTYDSDRLNELAVLEADDVVRTTQGSMDIVDSSSVERGPAYIKIVMPYANFFIHQRNLLMTQWKLNAREENLFLRYSKQAWLVGMGLIANGLVSEYIRMLANGDATNNADKSAEDNFESALWAVGKNVASTVHPVLGVMTSYGIDNARGEYTGNGMFATPALTWGESLVRLVTKVGEAAIDDSVDLTEKELRDFTKVIGIGMPILYNASNYSNTIYNLGAGNYYDTDFFDMSRALITGKASEDMKP